MPQTDYSLVPERFPSLDEARTILHEFTKSPNLRKHAEAVGWAMRAYALRYQQDPERWQSVGILHDFDYEQFPEPDTHPFRGADILRDRGFSEEFVRDIFAHAPHTKQPRDTLLRKAIFACDELCGFLVAVALIQPSKKLSEVTIERALKKLRQRNFAANVSRDDIATGAAELGCSLREHVGGVLHTLQDHAALLGL